jgi:site-specific DNA recombinase
MTPVYTLKRRKNGETYRIPYYRCSKTMHFTNEICSNKNINANLIEGLVLKDVAELSKNEDLLNISIERMNQDLSERVRPLEQEIKETEKRLSEIESEISNYVQALGKGKISVERLEQEIEQRQKEQEALKLRQEELQRQINTEATQDFNAELVKSTLQDFNRVFESLTPQEKSEALQCVLKDVTLYPDKVVLNIFELPGFKAGSQNRTNWLPRQDSNQGAQALVTGAAREDSLPEP